MPNTLAPLEPPYSEPVAALLANYPQRGGYLLTLFRTFANSERFLRKGVPNLLDAESPLPLRLREIAILRVTANLNCEYEWGVHVAAFSRQAELTDEQVAATKRAGADAPCWSGVEKTVLRAIDELCENATLAPETRASFQTAFTCEQQLELLAICGAYHTVSFVAHLAALPGEPFGAKFPSA